MLRNGTTFCSAVCSEVRTDADATHGHSALAASSKRNMTRATHWFPSLPFRQFQVLFNSLFKVLCIFPSRYLCAIGLPPIFSFRWNLPPTLSCNPKQLDSLSARAMTRKSQARTGVSPSQLPFSKGLGPGPRSTMPLQTTIRRARNETVNADSHGELFPFQSPLLGESLLVSFPPLNYMLKFSG